MDMLKKIWPFSFVTKANTEAFVINIVVHVVAMLVIGLICGIIAMIPAVGGVFAWIIGSIAELYIIAGIVFSCLDHFKVLK